MHVVSNTIKKMSVENRNSIKKSNSEKITSEINSFKEIINRRPYFQSLFKLSSIYVMNHIVSINRQLIAFHLIVVFAPTGQLSMPTSGHQ